MTAAFAASVVLLVSLLLGTHYERTQGVRALPRARAVLDRGTARAARAVSRGIARLFRYAHTDVLMRGLHMVAYSALVIVRSTEHKLVQLTRVLRSFRRRQEERHQQDHRNS